MLTGRPPLRQALADRARTEALSDNPARIIADAIARTGIYHKRTSLLAGVAALAACALVAVADEAPSKGAALFFAALLAVVTYRSVRAANRCFDVASSPVLRAIAREPQRIAKVWQQPSSAAVVVVEDDDGQQLPLRLGAERVAGVAPLLAAFAKIAPHAQVDLSHSDPGSSAADE